MKFRTKIWMLPVSAATVFVIGCACSYIVGANTSATLGHLRTRDYPAQETVTRIERHNENFRNSLQSAAIEGDEARLSDVEALGAATLAEIATLSKIDGQETLAGLLRDQATAYQSTALSATRAMLGKREPGNLLTQMQAHMTALDKQISAGKEQTMQAVRSSGDAADAGVQRGLWVVIGTCLAALAALGIASKVIVTSVWRDLGGEPTELNDAMRRIAEGDLSSKATANGSEVDPNSVSAALDVMISQLRKTVGTIRQATQSITHASREIASGNLDLSNRTENAASNLQHAASAMDELAKTVGNTAQSAVQARKLVSSAANFAQRGGNIMSQVVSNMNEINAASLKINDIIGVIDGIAFQTNILALNAAVEAARAGEQGRGFAVVAAEVRSLSARSAEAAKEIKTLIGMSSAKVENGSQLVDAAGNTMQEIMASVEHVTHVITEISNATTEQSSGIGSVSQSVSQLDQMTQQNAALVEQSAAAASSLSEQAQILAGAVAVFRLDYAIAHAPSSS
ncbi:methyl-accepting chemotaxis protein [Rhodoferax sp. TS-BS-61-7]|uniref:methyl-accepting chemotaxis protein n=1 Tax=Rhodoferax sp. TS-BS-61-7 TaxID=2094194 RepID=UPI000CF5E951|nr:methyl-accepting chemotaxis protein [Rhodoferax sp. TS-BS-61-7]PQA75943.1 chemotaxis protein [Rhodoferax sp. TS-BS-61-7]